MAVLDVCELTGNFRRYEGIVGDEQRLAIHGFNEVLHHSMGYGHLLDRPSQLKPGDRIYVILTPSNVEVPRPTGKIVKNWRGLTK